MSSEIFICHATADLDALVRPLWEGLTRRGLRAWCAPLGSLGPGPHLEEIAQVIERAEAAVIVVSPTSAGRPWPNAEVAMLSDRMGAARPAVVLPWFAGVAPGDLKGALAWVRTYQGAHTPDPVVATEVLASMALTALRAAAAREPRPLRVALASYNPKEEWVGEPDLLYAVPTDAVGPAAHALVDDLRWLREHLGAGPLPAIELQPRCSVALGVAAGAVLHRVWGGQVSVVQRTRDQVTTWDLRGGDPAHDLVTTVEAQGTPEELHLSVSLTTDVEPMRLAWAAGGPRHVALIARPQAGPGWTAVRDGAHATAMAEHLVGQLKALRSRHGALPVRLFLAGPQASCVALGRLLNAQGRWILMDKIGDAYAERVTITV